MTAFRRAAAVALVGAFLVLAACTSPSDDAAPPGSPSTTTGSPSPSVQGRLGTTDGADVPPPPTSGDCRQLGAEDLVRLSNDTDPVSCRAGHNAQTIHVGELGTTHGRPDIDSAAVRVELSTTCRREMASYLGGKESTRALSRFRVVWFSPTQQQANVGASWFRCDLIAFAGHEDLMQLPPPGRLAGVLDNPAALDKYGLCGTAAPGAAGFARVICAQPHSWRAISTIPVGGTGKYPGTRAVRTAGDEKCRDQVLARLGSPVRFRYGWEWPTEDQWLHGQRHGYCWAPD